MACDLIVAAEDAQLGEPEIRFGSAPVTLLMPYLIGQKKTRELLMTGDLIDAAEAERIGLVNRVVPADRLAAEVDALADRLARVPPGRHGADQADAQPGDGRRGLPRRGRDGPRPPVVHQHERDLPRVRRDRPAGPKTPPARGATRNTTRPARGPAEKPNQRPSGPETAPKSPSGGAVHPPILDLGPQTPRW